MRKVNKAGLFMLLFTVAFTFFCYYILSSSENLRSSLDKTPQNILWVFLSMVVAQGVLGILVYKFTLYFEYVRYKRKVSKRWSKQA